MRAIVSTIASFLPNDFCNDLSMVNQEILKKPGSYRLPSRLPINPSFYLDFEYETVAKP